MEKQFFRISYNGLDKETRIDCLAQIRRKLNPQERPGDFVDVDLLSKSTRSTKEDLKGVTPPEPGKFVKIGKISF